MITIASAASHDARLAAGRSPIMGDCRSRSSRPRVNAFTDVGEGPRRVDVRPSLDGKEIPMTLPDPDHRRAHNLVALAVGALALGACVDDVDTDTGAQALVLPAPIDDVPLGGGPCPTVRTDINQSMVVTAATHPGLTTRFTFARVMQQIVDTGGSALQNKLSVYQEWMATYAAPACSTIDPNGYGLPCPRAPEAQLAATDPFVTPSQAPFTAIGLFNRFDLAPQTGETCGEHRIVFALPSGLTRAFIIFEAALPNPQPGLGVDGCYPVTRFWQSLSGMTVAARLDALEAFYFTGVVEPITGVTIGPVVTAANYGLAVRSGPIRIDPPIEITPIDPVAETARVTGADDPAAVGARAMTDHVDADGMIMSYGGTARFGQIRTNMFVNFAEWNLREFKLVRDCTGLTRRCTLRFEHVPVAANPANELFLDSHANSAAFQASLIEQVAGLAAATDANQIALSTETNHDELESAPQRADVDFAAAGHASAGLQASITARLTTIGSPLSVGNILDRAKTQTCAGCHRRSAGTNLGGFSWPADAGFVHITEGGGLSAALTGTFLPRRRVVLDQFIAARCGPTPVPPSPVDEERTVSGAPVGSTN